MKTKTRGSGRLISLRNILLASSSLLIVFQITSGLSYAASVTAPTTAATSDAQNGASGLEISPLRDELTIQPGKAANVNITLKNITDGAVVAKASVLDFESDGSTGEPKILDDPNHSYAHSIYKFLVQVGNYTLQVNQSETITIPVQIPADTAPGAYYGLIEYQSVPEAAAQNTGTNKVALSAGVSTLVFVNVPGNVTEKMSLNNINVYKKSTGSESGVIFTKPPKAVGVDMDNLGNALETPFGRVNILKGGKTVYSYELNGGITRGIILPGSKRNFVNVIKNVHSIGKYTVSVSASYGNGSAILVANKTFWYVPTWALWVLLAIVIILLILAFMLYRYWNNGGLRLLHRGSSKRKK
jgi:hypothetical protein